MVLKVLSLFSGIGAFEKALTNLEVDYELIGYCEIDKYASKSYSAIHGVPESMNYGDITKVDEKSLAKDIDLITYGFPCQDISLAGKQQGLFNDDGSQTRSGLFFEALRIIEETKPKIAIAENVKNLVSKKFNAQFQVVLASLESAGYNNYWKVLNAKDYGVPQNRERVFIVSIRKDIDTGLFEFPEPFPLDKRLKDLLEEDVDEKYFISDKMKEYLMTISEKNKARNNGNVYKASDVDGVSKAITTKEGSRVKDNFIEEPQCVQVADLNHYQNDQMNRVYSPEGISPAVLTKTGGGRETKILMPEKTKKGYAEACEGDGVYLNRPHQKRGVVQKGMIQTLKCSGNDLGVVVNAGTVIDDTQGFDGVRCYQNYSPSLRANRSGLKTCDNQLRIRKLTPKECFRLMGFGDESFHKAEAVNSNTQLYKQAGNSIVVDVLEELFCMMLDEKGDVYV